MLFGVSLEYSLVWSLGSDLLSQNWKTKKLKTPWFVVVLETKWKDKLTTGSVSPHISVAPFQFLWLMIPFKWPPWRAFLTSHRPLSPPSGTDELQIHSLDLIYTNAPLGISDLNSLQNWTAFHVSHLAICCRMSAVECWIQSHSKSHCVYTMQRGHSFVRLEHCLYFVCIKLDVG